LKSALCKVSEKLEKVNSKELDLRSFKSLIGSIIKIKEVDEINEMYQKISVLKKVKSQNSFNKIIEFLQELGQSNTGTIDPIAILNEHILKDYSSKSFIELEFYIDFVSLLKEYKGKSKPVKTLISNYKYSLQNPHIYISNRYINNNEEKDPFSYLNYPNSKQINRYFYIAAYNSYYSLLLTIKAKKDNLTIIERTEFLRQNSTLWNTIWEMKYDVHNHFIFQSLTLTDEPNDANPFGVPPLPENQYSLNSITSIRNSIKCILSKDKDKCYLCEGDKRCECPNCHMPLCDVHSSVTCFWCSN